MFGVGLALQPETAFLDLLDQVICTEADYYEVIPETLWWEDENGVLRDNSFFRRLESLCTERPKPIVGHGVGLSLSGVSKRDAQRRRNWWTKLVQDHQKLRFAWYTDHLGITAPDGMAAMLPLPPWQTPAAVTLLRKRLRRLQTIVPQVGIENSVFYFSIDDPLEEPRFLRNVLSLPGMYLLLDLHNVYTSAVNFHFDPREYLARLDLTQVIELHLSGGTISDGSWLPSGKQLRLDSHDDAVPEPVWDLLDFVLPKCTGLKGITLERMEGTVGEAEVPLIREELRRAKRALRTHWGWTG